MQLLMEKIAVFLLSARTSVTVPDRLGEVDVRRRSHGAPEVDFTVAAVRIADVPGRAYRHRIAVVGVVNRRDGHPGVVEQREHRRQLERRTRLHAAAQGIVLPLGETPVGIAAEVDHRQDFARMDLHHDRRAPQSILGFQLSPQRLVGHILQVEVERRDDVEAVHRVLVVPARHPAVKPRAIRWRRALPSRPASSSR